MGLINSLHFVRCRIPQSNARARTSALSSARTLRDLLGLALFACTTFLISCSGVGGNPASSQNPPTGDGSGQLSLSSASIDFGDVTVGSSDTKTVTLTNSGTASVTIAQADLTGTGFSLSSILLTLAAGQTTTFDVTFAPASSGNASGSLSLLSDAANSPTTLSLAGNGVAPIAHEVDLFWDPSSSPNVAGYNVYRAIQSGGPYMKLNPVLIVSTTYTDATVMSGATYFYVVTAEDVNGVESQFSNEAVAVIPFP